MKFVYREWQMSPTMSPSKSDKNQPSKYIILGLDEYWALPSSISKQRASTLLTASSPDNLPLSTSMVIFQLLHTFKGLANVFHMFETDKTTIFSLFVSSIYSQNWLVERFIVGMLFSWTLDSWLTVQLKSMHAFVLVMGITHVFRLLPANAIP